MKRKAIRVPLESWVYLQNQQMMQRCGKVHSEEYVEHLKREMEKPYNKEGHLLMDGSLGGAIGNPNNSYEEGRWTNWSIETMKKMLDENGYTYIDVEDVDVIDVSI